MVKSMSSVRLILADDQVLFVESLRIVLETRASNLEVVGIAHDGKETIRLVHELNPDVVLMDVRMPVMDGVEATKKIRNEYPNVKIIMLTTFDDDEYVSEAIRWGAVGYILKNIPPYQLINSIQAVLEGGGFFLSPSIAERLANTKSAAEDEEEEESSNAEVAAEWLNEITPREKELLRLLVQGYDNQRIAEELFLAEQTVKNRVSAIYSKLNVHNRLDAIRKLRAMNIDALF